MKKRIIILSVASLLVILTVGAALFLVPKESSQSMNGSTQSTSSPTNTSFCSIQGGLYSSSSQVNSSIEFNPDNNTFSVVDSGIASDLPEGKYHCADGKLYAEYTPSPFGVVYEYVFQIVDEDTLCYLADESTPTMVMKDGLIYELVKD